MSDEWPPAPRMEQALEDEAASVQIDPVARRRLDELLADGDSAPTHHSLDKPSHQGSPRFLAIAAVLTIIAAGAVALSVQRGETSETATTTSPRLSCEMTTSLTEYHLGNGELAVGGRVNQPPDGAPVISFVSLADASSWHDVADSQRIHQHLDGRSSITYAASATAEVADSLVGAQCTAHIYLIIDGMSAAALDEFICAPGTQTRGPSGIVLVRPSGPPISCAISQPLILVGPDVLSDQLVAWERHLGCAPAAVRPEGSVVRSAGCKHTLVAAETAADPWDNTIEGLPVSAWVMTIATIPN